MVTETSGACGALGGGGGGGGVGGGGGGEGGWGGGDSEITRYQFWHRGVCVICSG